MPPSRGPGPSRPPVAAIATGLVAATLVAYAGVRGCGFVDFDDDRYVSAQPMVNQGWRWAAVVWAFTAAHVSNWHPLTSLSHVLDCTLFGVAPVPMHWENVAWHAANALLVFAVWRAATGALWRPATVAALFALHPLHVESVAWISERKDVLCAFWWLVGIAAYLRWCRRQTVSAYAGVALAAALALLAKPMAVTFPLTLLLLDVWPLGRLARDGWRRVVTEKVPLFVLAALDAVVTVVVQRASGAAEYGMRLALAERLGNAVVALVRYLAKTVWPTALAVIYPHPGAWPLPVMIGAVAVVVAITWLAWRQRERRPWLAFGWAWFVVTLLPTLGLIQVGAQSMADRYTYVPLLGIFTAAAWTGGEVAERRPSLRRPLAAAVVVALAVCGALTSRQVGLWAQSVTLYEHAIAVGYDGARVRCRLGLAELAAGAPRDRVAAEFERAIALDPDEVNARIFLSAMALQESRLDDARRWIGEALRVGPRDPAAENIAGWIESVTGDPQRAEAHYRAALALDPHHPAAHYELALLYLRTGRLDDAELHLRASLAAAPWNAIAATDLGALLVQRGNVADGRAWLERALWIDPGAATARELLSRVARSG